MQVWELANQESYNWGAYAPPYVLGDSLLITAGDGAIRCVTIDSGKIVWSSSYAHTGFMNKRIVLDDSQLYGFSGREEVFAIKLSDGTSAWSALIDSNREFGTAMDIDNNSYFIGINGYNKIRRIMKYDKFTGDLQDSLRVDHMPWSLTYESERLYSTYGWPSGPNDIGRVICYGSNVLDSIWSYSSEGGTFSVCPPVIDSGILYAGTVWGGSLGNEVVALNAETGELIWRTETYGCYQIVLDGDVLYCDLAGGVLALDKTTGEVLWETHLPVACETSGLAYWDGYLYNEVCGGLYIYDAETGEVVHKTRGPDSAYIYQVSAGAGKIFVQSSQHLYAFEPFNPDVVNR